ncbi:DegV family protein, partial [Streptococcus gordonii]|uniref:DegV family protein n=1 Tax=Streptococcus gordonii TaxID=1302 RepID=UPI001D15C9FF
MANNRQIETLGVSYLTTFINRNKLLQTYFDNNDKTPAWDGEIHVLKSASEKKSEIFGKVPVQIKATRQKKNSMKSFSVDIRDLELYSKNGGVVLFVVYSDSDLKEGEFLRLMKESKNLPKTSQPPVGVFAEVFEALAETADH